MAQYLNTRTHIAPVRAEVWYGTLSYNGREDVRAAAATELITMPAI
jgi:hypothetical protein